MRVDIMQIGSIHLEHSTGILVNSDWTSKEMHQYSLLFSAFFTILGKDNKSLIVKLFLGNVSRHFLINLAIVLYILKMGFIGKPYH